MNQTSEPSSYLRHFSKLVCAATFFLIFAGSLVTSNSAGLAVPDWPLSYGMVFPPMVGGVFYEHGHRLIAASVGFLTVILFVWALRVEKRKWVKWLAFLALLAVILQGTLGGLTVLFFLPTAISVSHAILGQSFFLITLWLAYAFSLEFKKQNFESSSNQNLKSFFKWSLFFLAIIYVQLFLGALMRHTASGLAIYDFPLMAGEIIPGFDNTMLQTINSWRFDFGYDPVTLSQVWIHFFHRLGAFFVTIAAIFLTYSAWHKVRHNKLVWYTVLTIDIFLIIQISLGAFTIWSQKEPNITSFHVLTGAGILGLSALLVLRSYPYGIAKKI